MATPTTRAGVASSTLLDPPTMREAEVGPGDTGIVNYTGNVSIQVLGHIEEVERIDVSLNVSTYGSGWPCNISPSHISIDPRIQEKIPFEVTVYVPPGTPYTTSERVIVTALVEPFPEGEVNVSSFKGTVTVSQYHQFSVKVSEPYFDLRGRRQSYIINISNEGNGHDTFEIEITNFIGLNYDGWVISLTDSRSNVDYNESGEINISITPPTSIPDGTYEIYVRVGSEQARTLKGLDISENYTIFVEVDRTKSSKESSSSLTLLAIIIAILVIALLATLWLLKKPPFAKAPPPEGKPPAQPPIPGQPPVQPSLQAQPPAQPPPIAPSPALQPAPQPEPEMSLDDAAAAFMEQPDHGQQY